MKKKVVKLTEQDLEKLVKKIIKEEGVGPLHGFKFKVNHNSYTYVIDDTGGDTLGIRIVGDDDYRSTTTRDEVKNKLHRRLWHDAKTYKFNPNLKIR